MNWPAYDRPGEPATVCQIVLRSSFDSVVAGESFNFYFKNVTFLNKNSIFVTKLAFINQNYMFQTQNI